MDKNWKRRKYLVKILLMLLFSIFVSCFPLKVYLVEAAGNAKGKRYYIKDVNNHYDNVTGVWKWKEGNNSFEITFRKFEKINDPLAPSIYKDKIFGKYKLITDGKIISEVEQIDPFPNTKVTLIFITPNSYSIIIRDVISERHKVGEFIITSPKIATLKLKNEEGVRLIFDKDIAQKEFALPMEIILEKIN